MVVVGRIDALISSGELVDVKPLLVLGSLQLLPHSSFPFSKILIKHTHYILVALDLLDRLYFFAVVFSNDLEVRNFKSLRGRLKRQKLVKCLFVLQ